MPISATDRGVLLRLKVKPRAKTEGPIAGKSNSDAIVWAVKAPPVDGKANEALIRSVAQFFSVIKSEVQIVRGETSNAKTLLLVGKSVEEVRRQLRDSGLGA